MGSEDTDYISLKMLTDDDGFFGLPLEPLHDFNVGLEASDLDSLLDQFEEQTEKLFQQHFGEMGSNSENLSLLNTTVKSVSEKVVGHKVGSSNSQRVTSSPASKSSSSKSLLNAKSGSVKRKKGGISLLAKPNKVKSVMERRAQRERTTSPSHFEHYFYQDHDYCPNPLS